MGSKANLTSFSWFGEAGRGKERCPILLGVWREEANQPVSVGQRFTARRLKLLRSSRLLCRPHGGGANV